MQIDIESVVDTLKTIPNHWDAKQCITQMRNEGSNSWRQMEWIGWFFQHWCKENLSSKMVIPCPIKFNNTEFDALYDCPIDFKAVSGLEKIGLNDTKACFEAISMFGKIRFIVALGFGNKDISGDFKKWHDKIKGGVSDYEKKRIERGATSRTRKKSFDVTRIITFEIDHSTLTKCNEYQKGWRNADGTKRNPKLEINLKDIEEKIIDLVAFENDKKPKASYTNLEKYF